MKALKELRRSLGEDATYAVSKNTLTTIAARQAGVEGIDDLLVGPTAIAFIDGDPVVVAKGLRDFARNNPQLVIKGGVLDGKPSPPTRCASSPTWSRARCCSAKAAGAMKGVLAQAVSLFAAPLSQAARLVAALEKAATENPALIAGAGAPARPRRHQRAQQRRAGSGGRCQRAEQRRAGRAAAPPSRLRTPSSEPPEPLRKQLQPRTRAPAAETATEAAPAADETHRRGRRCGRQVRKERHHGEAQH